MPFIYCISSKTRLHGPGVLPARANETWNGRLVRRRHVSNSISLDDLARGRDRSERDGVGTREKNGGALAAIYNDPDSKGWVLEFIKTAFVMRARHPTLTQRRPSVRTRHAGRYESRTAAQHCWKRERTRAPRPGSASWGPS